MSPWSDSYEDERRDREYAFVITCPQCGRERSNLDGDRCQCGSSSESYRSADASRWNRYVEGRIQP